MKTTPLLITMAGLLGLLVTTSGQVPDSLEKKPPAEVPQKPPAPEGAPVEPTQPAEPAPPQSGPGPAALTSEPAAGEGEKGLRMNFRGVPLEMVLEYLSDAAGFIIVLEADVKGKVDAWSNQPLSKEEAVNLLNTVLNKNGYAAIRNGRTLRIVSRDEAKTKDIPVRSGSDPEAIPKSDEMVTQVIPVRYANAAQLTQNLVTLLPTYATLSANESGNALVLTATQSEVRRMTEIVRALDTSIASISAIRVFPLRYADAKTLADAVKELFQPQQQNNNDRRNRFLNRIFGGGGPGGFPGPGGFGGNTGGGGRDTGTAGSSVANTRVVAVADERANALVVSAPEEYMPTIEKLVEQMDVSVADVTELRVFFLRNADPLELADIFAELFPDETRTRDNQNANQAGFRFGGEGNRGGFGNRNANQTASSERMKKMGRVVAVPDQRTSSLIVSAASELMPQIAAMIEQLDASSSKRQRVYVYSLENADVQQVEQVVRDMFQRSTVSGNRGGLNQNSPLLNRSQQNQQTVPGATLGGFGAGNQGGFGGNTGQAFR
jgi:general secretion pathway protein D